MNKPMQTDRILRMKELPAKVGIQKSLIYELIKKGEFPKPIKLGERARGFRESEVDAFLSKRGRAPVIAAPKRTQPLRRAA